MKELVLPGTLLQYNWTGYTSGSIIMFVETKQNDNIIKEVDDPTYYDHWFITKSGKLESYLDEHKQFCLEDHTWLKKVEV